MNYYGLDKSNDLQHWKYLKRYKGSNGKWRYVYASKTTHKQIKDLQESSKESYSKYAQANYYAQKYGSGKNSLEKMYADYNKNVSNAQRDEADAAISSNSVKNLATKKINKGKAAVSSLLNKVSKFVYSESYDFSNSEPLKTSNKTVKW